jgi:hypothetical protein
LREYFSFVASLLDVSSLLTGWDGRRNGDLPQTTCFLIVFFEYGNCNSREGSAGRNFETRSESHHYCNAMALMYSLECLVYWDLVNLLVSDRGVYTS